MENSTRANKSAELFPERVNLRGDLHLVLVPFVTHVQLESHFNRSGSPIEVLWQRTKLPHKSPARVILGIIPSLLAKRASK
jgi:hypothetical protein